MVQYADPGGALMDVRRLIPLMLVLMTLAAMLGACGPRDAVTFIPEGGTYTADDLAGLLSKADLGDRPELAPERIADARQRALADLRRQGADAAALADTLTADFPADVAAVPVSVERADYEGQPAWIVIEATADESGRLTYRRLWVFSYGERAVIAARSSR